MLPIILEEKLRKTFLNFDEFFSNYNEEPFKGLRVNTLKFEKEKLGEFELSSSPTPFCPEGFYIKAEDKLGKHPLHHAGAFYIQEPSASSAVEVLDPKPYDFVLDLCAAPGGKSTQIAARLEGKGLIWSNEIVFKRANILLSNFERMGIHNSIISSCHPDTLSSNLEGFFDKILVDAPCSGEGMMRHDSSIAPEWTQENVNSCAERQLKILNSAAKMLRCGGEMVYSTCTFSKEENEDVALRFLAENPEFEPMEIKKDFGVEGLCGDFTLRVFPVHGGEGHFIAKFRKKGAEEKTHLSGLKPSKSDLLNEFLNESKIILPEGIIYKEKEKYYLSPDIILPRECGIIRRGIALGEEIKGRFQPHHALFSAASVICENAIDLKIEDERVEKYLHGEEIDAPNEFKGYVRVSVEGVSLGFGKASKGRLKNHYPKGLRNF